MWNIPRLGTPFLAAYEQLWRKYLNPQAVNSETDSQAYEDELRAWYSPGLANLKVFDNAQIVDDEGLKGRVLSSSYAPAPDRPEYAAMLKELETLFQNHQVRGTVTLEYECRMCYGQFQ